LPLLIFRMNRAEMNMIGQVFSDLDSSWENDVWVFLDITGAVFYTHQAFCKTPHRIV